MPLGELTFLWFLFLNILGHAGIVLPFNVYIFLNVFNGNHNKTLIYTYLSNSVLWGMFKAKPRGKVK